MSTKFLRIQPDGFMELRDLDQERDLLDVIHDELDGGFFEIVRCRTLPRKFVMLVDDCGYLKGLPLNPIAPHTVRTSYCRHGSDYERGHRRRGRT